MLDRKANILSFDGGGSKGIMEAAVLDSVMRLVKILERDPNALEYLTENDEKLLNETKRKALVDDLSKVTKSIHPIKVFDMIVGTSTGGLIAFGLVGGNTDDKGKRIPMSLKECIEMYLKNTRKIFQKSWSQWLATGVFGLFSNIPPIPYSQDNLKEVLANQFADSNLGDYKECESVAAVVTRRIDQKEELILFDTWNDACKLTEARKVLLATTDAPVYFETPVKIGHHDYVDGGVGGNCPLAQAIPRAQELFGDVNFVLSVAPPSPKRSEIPSLFQLKYWLNYFAHQSTDGYAVYKDVKRRHESIFFRRFAPRGDVLKNFELDENDAQKMLDDIEAEKLANELFLTDIIATATFVFDAYICRKGSTTEESLRVGARLARLAGNIYAAEFMNQLADDSFKVSLRFWRRISEESSEKSIGIAETEGDYSESLIREGMYREASQHAFLSLESWQAIHGNKDHQSVSHALLVYGKSLHLSGDYREGYKNYELALEMQKRINSENGINESIATTMVHMAWLCREHGKLEKAASFLTQAIQIRKELHGTNDHIDVSRNLDSLGLLFTTQGKFIEGEKYLQDSLSIKKRLVGNKNHPAIAASYNNLGWCLLRQRRYKEAQEHLQKALGLKLEFHGENDHKSISLTLDSLAKSLLHQGQLNKALEYAQQALEMKKRCLEDMEGPIMAKTMHTIGLCLVKKKSFSEAYEHIRKAVKIIENAFESRSHPVLATFLPTLGDSLVGKGNLHDAKVHYMDALNIIDHDLGGDDNPDAPSLLQRLADLCKQLNQKQNEMEYRRRLEKIGRRIKYVDPHSKSVSQPLIDEEICPQTNRVRPFMLGFEANEAAIDEDAIEQKRTEL